MKQLGGARDILSAETYTLPYAARLAGPGSVMILSMMDPVFTGVMPAKQADRGMAAFKPLYPVIPAKSVLDSGLYTMDPVVHVSGCILNAGRIELMQGEFGFYREGITLGVGRVMEQLDQERMAIINKLGYTPVSVTESLVAMGATGKNVYEAITTNEQFAKIKGPDGFKNRYYTEDIPYNHSFLGLCGAGHWRAHAGDGPLITLNDGLLGRDCRKTEWTLEDLGLEGMDIDAIHDYLHNG